MKNLTIEELQQLSDKELEAYYKAKENRSKKGLFFSGEKIEVRE